MICKECQNCDNYMVCELGGFGADHPCDNRHDSVSQDKEDAVGDDFPWKFS